MSSFWKRLLEKFKPGSNRAVVSTSTFSLGLFAVIEVDSANRYTTS
jgi:hypothetical protein